MSVQNNASSSRVSWRLGQKVWQWSSTRQALLFALLPVAIALIVSSLLPQVPADLRADEFKYETWLSAQQIQFKNWTPLLTAVGAFHIRETLWFRVLLTILCFVLLVGLGEQVRILVAPVSIAKPSRFYDAAEAESLSSPLPYDQAVQRARRPFPRARVQTDSPETTYLYARRHTWARASAAVCYLGLLLLASGQAIDTRWGWRQSEIQVLPYNEVLLGPDGSLELLLLELHTASAEGHAAVPTANLQVASQAVLSIQLGAPVHHRGYRYRWVSRGGPSVRLHAYRVSAPEQALTLYDYAVRPLPAQSLQFNFAPGQESDRQFILSEDKVVGWLLWDDEQTTADDGSSAFYIWVFGEDGQELGVEAFSSVESEANATTLQAVVGDVIYRLDVAQYIVLDIAHQPGRWVLWLGVALLSLGCAGLLVPRQQIWIKAAAQDGSVIFQVRAQNAGLAPGRKNWQDVLSRLSDALQVPPAAVDAAPAPEASVLPSDPESTTHRKNT